MPCPTPVCARSSRFVLVLIVSACCLASSAASAQVRNDNRLSWVVTGQVFDVARVANTLYVAGPANLGATLVSDDTDEPFALLDPTTGHRPGRPSTCRSPKRVPSTP